MNSFNLRDAIHTLPGGLEDLLVRGAYLEHHARSMEQRRGEEVARLDTIRATQPPFLFLRPKETRSSFQTATRDTTASLTAVDNALALTRRLRDHLRSCSEEMLEKWLRSHCKDYHRQIEIIHLLETWTHAHARLEKNAHKFTHALKSAQNLAADDHANQRAALSPSTYQVITVAHAAAIKVEAEISECSKLADHYETMTRKAGLDASVPRPLKEPYSDVLSQISGLSSAGAHKELNRVVAVADHLANHEIVSLHKHVRDALHVHRARAHDYLRDAWDQLHTHALSHSIDPRHIVEVVAQTERIYHMKDHRGTP